MHRRLTLAVLTAGALIASGLVGPGASAAELPESEISLGGESVIVDQEAIAEVQAEYEGLDGEEIVEQGLGEEGYAAEEVTVTPDGVTVGATAVDDETSFELSLDPGLPTGTFTMTDIVDGEPTTTVFDVAIEESTPERTAFELSNPQTGETYEYDSDIATTSVAFVIPIAFGAVTLATAIYYLSIGAAIIIGGVLALEAVKAIDKIIADNKKKPSDKKRDFYPAATSGAIVYISPNGLTSTQAKNRARNGGDIWSISRDRAKALAKSLNLSGTAIGPERHGNGYLRHYHPAKRDPKVHIFYGGPVWDNVGCQCG